MADTCGLGTWFRPQWLRRFATPRCFFAVYGILGTVQVMSYVYFVATITTLEKRFKIPSRTLGVVMSGNEISQVLLSLSLSYYGGQGNRPRWIAWGVAFSGLSCYILALPHLVYGPGYEALALTEEFLDTAVLNTTTNTAQENFLPLCSGNMSRDIDCEAATSGGEYSLMPLVLVFLSQFVLGIGTTLYYALGQTYLDDNTKKTDTPMLLGWVMAFRTAGPALAFFLGYACLRLYIDPHLTPVISSKDPRWIGAWWLGWLILGTAMVVLSVFLGMFPKKMPSQNPKQTPFRTPEECPLNKEKLLSDFLPADPIVSKQQHNTPAQSSDFKVALRRLLKNRLLMCNVVAGVFYILGASGYITFAPKYLETQFQQSAAGASVVIGSAGILAAVVGFLASGYIISKFRPRASLVLGWNVFVGFSFIIGEIIFVFLGCPENTLQGFNPENGQLEVINDCNIGCGCENLKYTPVCDVESGITIYSACHAGCHSIINTTIKAYENCQCAGATVLPGPCPANCRTAFIAFLITSVFIHSLGSSGKVGNLLVNYRCVATEDKSFAQGLSLLLVSLFAFIPGPILYGVLVDAACLIWDQSCGKKGNCWLYHRDNLRLYFNLTAVGLTAVGVILDIAVWHLGKSLDLYGEPAKSEKQKTIGSDVKRKDFIAVQ